jgi:hypothetical protein
MTGLKRCRVIAAGEVDCHDNEMHHTGRVVVKGRVGFRDRERVTSGGGAAAAVVPRGSKRGLASS